MSAPKAFISYSWSSQAHERMVIGLATELRESSGVDVILDKWDLKEGHDAIAFMEQMVTNPDIKKVIIISDRVYAEKADGRAGGVGTETQIISKEVYDKQAQDKFVAVVTEKDEEGRPYLPTYYKSRIFIDLSEVESYSDNFERLLRWIFDKPLYIKPELGKAPEFLSEGDRLSLGTSVLFRRCMDAIRNDKAYALGAFEEYCKTVTENLDRFRLKDINGEIDDAVVQSIEELMPFRDEAIKLFIALAQYGKAPEYFQALHRFFENLIPYMYNPGHGDPYKEWDFDNFKFIIHELYLYALAVLIKYERFVEANLLLQQRYYVNLRSIFGDETMVRFIVFKEYLKSLDYRNKRLKLNRLSVHSDLLHARAAASGIDFNHFMQADFIAFLRADLELPSGYDRWWPDTLLYIRRERHPFEVFARSISKRYFDRMKILLNIDKPADLEPLFEQYRMRQLSVPSWQFDSFSPSALVGYSQLATIE